MSRGSSKVFAALIVWTLSCPYSAIAGSCDSFNLRFDPQELQRCIDEMKFDQMIESKNRELEIGLLRLEVCDPAVKLTDLKSDVNDFIKETCVPIWEEAKKRAQARSKLKKDPSATPIPLPRTKPSPQ
jgi:hypothetical protein